MQIHVYMTEPTAEILKAIGGKLVSKGKHVHGVHSVVEVEDAVTALALLRKTTCFTTLTGEALSYGDRWTTSNNACRHSGW